MLTVTQRVANFSLVETRTTETSTEDFSVGDLVDVRHYEGSPAVRSGLKITERKELKSGVRLTLEDGSQWEARRRRPWRSRLIAPPTLWRHGGKTW